MYVLVSPRLCRISAKKACLSFLIVQLQLPFSTPLTSFACNACSFVVYIYALHTKLTAYATFYPSEHCLWINFVHSMHLTELTKKHTTADYTKVFPKVTTESHSLRRESSSFRCLPSSLFFLLSIATLHMLKHSTTSFTGNIGFVNICPTPEVAIDTWMESSSRVRQHENRKFKFFSIKV